MYVVNVAYPFEGDFTLDINLTKLAHKLNGARGDSGAGFGQRDIEYFFQTREQADSFKTQIKAKFKKVKVDRIRKESDWFNFSEYDERKEIESIKNSIALVKQLKGKILE